MPNAIWPATLPAPLADTGTNYGAPTNVIETAMEGGPAKIRRRYTAVELPFACSLKLSAAQLATLEAFYYTTLQQVLPFDWTDFRTSAAATYRFGKDGYTASYIAGQVGRWQVSMKLWRKP